MRICILGAGWFGCFIADELIKKGFQVKIYEKEKDIFLNASGNNQNRLHLGFHYPRSSITRKLSKSGFKIFKKQLSKFSKKVKNNYYAVAKSPDSKIDFKKYCSVMRKEKYSFKNVNPDFFPYLKNLEGVINCDEELILLEKVKKYYKKILKKNILFNYEVKAIGKKQKKYIIDSKEYDMVINCTSLQFGETKIKNILHEYCAIFLYRSVKKNHPAVTIMDGPFFTLFPWNGKRNYGLYSVEGSRILVGDNFRSLEKKVNNINKKLLQKIRIKIEKKFSYFYPSFKKEFKFVKFLNSYRIIVKNKNDTRTCVVKEKNNFIDIFSGKIDHIFYALKEVERCLKKF